MSKLQNLKTKKDNKIKSREFKKMLVEFYGNNLYSKIFNGKTK